MNCQFAFAVHVLSVMALAPDRPQSSGKLAISVNTNPVVIRRLLLDLSKAGLVVTARGSEGGSKLARPAAQISLADIYRAVAEDTRPFDVHPRPPDDGCPVGHGIKRVLEEVGLRAAHAVEREYEAINLAEIARSMNPEPAPA